jgi:hypothetical protein
LDFTAAMMRDRSETVTVSEAKVGTPDTASWKVTNNFAALDTRERGEV